MAHIVLAISLLGAFNSAYGQAIETPAKAEKDDLRGQLNTIRLRLDAAKTEAEQRHIIADLQILAEENFADAAFLLGEIYSGRIANMEPEASKAIAAYEKAARAGHQASMLRLGELNLDGKLIPQDKEKALDVYKKAADLGNSFALFKMGDIYLQGVLVHTDRPLAIRYLKKAADLGYTRAWVRLGDAFASGNDPDLVQSTNNYMEAANAGNSEGRLKLANAYLNGFGVTRDIVKGITSLEAEAKAGNVPAAFMLGNLYAKGDIVPVETGKAVFYLTQAADAGNDRARMRLGEIYRDGILVPSDPQKAFQLFSLAAQSNYGPGLVRLGEAFIRGFGTAPDVKRGLALLRKGAESGENSAKRTLGDLLSSGDLVEQDGDMAIAAYQAAANAGDADAHVRLAEIYRDGHLVRRDPKKAIAYYEMAINAGSARALVSLAEAHLFNRLGPLSEPDKGLDLIQTALSKGEPTAPNVLSSAYLNGKGVPTDPKKAVAILLAAADSGNAQAAKLLISLYRDGRGKKFAKESQRAEEILKRYSPILSIADRSREAIMLAAAAARNQVDYRKVVDLIDAAPAAVQFSTITGLKAANENAYVFVAQDRLKKRGIYSGPINGTLTHATIRAINIACRRLPGAKKCDQGPLSTDAVRLIATILS